VAAAGYPLTPLDTMFFGGGTPTLLPPGDLTGLVARARAALGLAADAEVTVEANPDSVGPETFEALAAGGVTRVSLGMQSAVPRVLATLDRTHAPEAVPRAVAWAKAAGLAVSVDLIYGTPGENLADWEASLRAALDLGTDHISAYALTLEPHVPLARRLAAAGSPGPDDSDEAAKYELADRLLGDAGFAWYEISNWARGPAARSRHNLGYWRGQDWLAIGPGAHGGLGGGAPVRWWNLPHPSRWAGAIAEGTLPVAGWDAPDAAGWSIERVMLGIRLAEGLPTAVLSAAGRDAIGPLEDDGLVRLERRPDGQGEEGERVVLTLRGRLLADTVTRALTA
jgi:oxygen-independent coproporphyrinogen-3 oxidase